MNLIGILCQRGLECYASKRRLPNREVKRGNSSLEVRMKTRTASEPVQDLAYRLSVSCSPKVMTPGKIASEFVAIPFN